MPLRYFDNWTVANRLTAKIEDWCVREKGLAPGRAYELYKEHGTALRGLLREGILEDEAGAIDGYLEDVHDVGVPEALSPNPGLRAMLLRINPAIPKYVFTASVKRHAERCLEALGIADLFDGIVDTRTCGLQTKHSRAAFEAAMRFAGVADPAGCLLLDDSVKNLRCAGEMGWRSVLVGLVGRDDGRPVVCDDCEAGIDRIEELPGVLPEIFRA
jgi:putative hydrolase of the HAD superfamily/pyrimidine and pyridine-specific 5'-nucleotidase